MIGEREFQVACEVWQTMEKPSQWKYPTMFSMSNGTKEWLFFFLLGFVYIINKEAWISSAM